MCTVRGVEESARAAGVVYELDAAFDNGPVFRTRAPREGIEVQTAVLRAAIDDAQPFVLERVFGVGADVFALAGHRSHGRACAVVDAVPLEFAVRRPRFARECHVRGKCEDNERHRHKRWYCRVLHPKLPYCTDWSSNHSDGTQALQTCRKERNQDKPRQRSGRRGAQT